MTMRPVGSRLPSKGLDLEAKITFFSEPRGECRIWTGGVNQINRPILNHKGEVIAIQKYILAGELERELLPNHLADQSCGNRLCVEKAHQLEVRRGYKPKTTLLAQAGKAAPPSKTLRDSPYASIELSELSLDQKIKHFVVPDRDGCDIYHGRMESGHPYLFHDGLFVSVRRHIIERDKADAQERQFLGMRCGKERCVRAACMVIDPPLGLAAHEVEEPPANPDMPLSEFIVKYHYDEVMGYIGKRVKTGVDKGDIFGEVMLRFTEGGATLRTVHSPLAYTFTAASNLISEKSQRYARSCAMAAAGVSGLFVKGECAIFANYQEANGDHDSDYAEAHLQGKQIQPFLDILSTQMSRKQAGIVLMHAIYGFTYGEIADLIGISCSMVKKYLNLGFAQLREYAGVPNFVKIRRDATASAWLAKKPRKSSQESHASRPVLGCPQETIAA